MKCGVFANAFDADEDEDEDEGEGAREVEVEVEESDDVYDASAALEEEVKVVADVPFAAKRAARVSSACETNDLLPVRRASR